MVRQMDREDVRILGYCEECGIEITDDFEEYYCDENGPYYCSCECAMEHYGLHKLEV